MTKTLTLIWEESRANQSDIISKCLVGMYRIQYVSKRRYDLRLNTVKLSKHSNQEQAKDAAQLNYEQHLKS